MKRRVLALVLCVVLTFTFGTASVFACNDHGSGHCRRDHGGCDWDWDCDCDWDFDWDCDDDWDWDCEDEATFEVKAEDAVYDTLPHGGEIVKPEEDIRTSPIYYIGVEGTDYKRTEEAPTEVGTYVAYAFGCFEVEWAKFEITPATVKITLNDQEIYSGEKIADVWYENCYAEGFLGDAVFDAASLKDREFTAEDVKIVVVNAKGEIVEDYSAIGTYTLRVIPTFKCSAYDRNYQILESKIFDGTLTVKENKTEETGDNNHLLVWSLAMAVCMAGAAVLVLKKRA